MFQISEWMNRKPLTIEESDDLERIEALMREFRVRHLPVMRGRKLVGVVSHRDFIRALEMSRRRVTRERIWAMEIMTRDLFTLTPKSSVADALRLLIENKIGCVPVVSDGALVGLVTDTELLRFALELVNAREQLPFVPNDELEA